MKARVALAKALVVLGFAASELALIAVTLNPDTSRFMVRSLTLDRHSRLQLLLSDHHRSNSVDLLDYY